MKPRLIFVFLPMEQTLACSVGTVRNRSLLEGEKPQGCIASGFAWNGVLRG
jgi:hypothetical protein